MSQAHASFQSDWTFVLGGVRLRVRAVEGDDAHALPATVEPCVASRRLFTDNWWFDLSFALFLLPQTGIGVPAKLPATFMLAPAVRRGD